MTPVAPGLPAKPEPVPHLFRRIYSQGQEPEKLEESEENENGRRTK